MHGYVYKFLLRVSLAQRDETWQHLKRGVLGM